MKHLILSGCVALLLTACGGGGDSDGNSNNGNPTGAGNQGPSNSTIQLSGADAATFGSSLSIDEAGYRQDAGGSPELVVATTEGLLAPILALLDGETPDFSGDEPADFVVLNILPFGISMGIERNGTSYGYTLTCVSDSGLGSSCPSITIDANNQTVTLINAVLEPVIGGDDDSQATAQLTLDGTITWDQSGDISNGGGNNNGTPSNGNANAGDIVGTWDLSTSEAGGTVDEYYTIFRADGTYTDYDYDGDSFDMGDNCYYIYDGTYQYLGNGRFSFDGEQTASINISGDSLTANADSGFVITATRSTLTESSFSPDCE